MHFIFFYSSTTFFVFLLFAFALGFATIEALQNILSSFSVFIFLYVVSVSIYYICKFNKLRYRSKDFSDILMTLLASAICLFTSILFFSHLKVYGADFSDRISFAVEALCIGVPWLCVLSGWQKALMEIGTHFNYDGFKEELLGFGIIFLIFIIF